MKKFLALFLAAIMLMSVVGCATVPPVVTDPTVGPTDPSNPIIVDTCPDYVNLDSALPFVKEGSEEVTLTMWVAALDDGTKEVEKTWQWAYLQDVGNVKLEITLVPWSTKEEKKNLALATGEIPDIMYGMQLTAADLVTYGSTEHVIADLKPLIDNYAPAIKATMDMYKNQAAAWTAPDGGVYSLSSVGKETATGGYKIFVNKQWMADAGITELPTTLDGFTDMLEKFKTLHPEEEYVPLGGYHAADYPLGIILQALGFNINSFRGERIYDYASVNGDHVSVIGTDPLYAEFLKVANDWYTKGLIHKDFFTIDHNVARAQAAQEKCGVYVQFGMSTMYGFLSNSDQATKDAYLDNWVVMEPLTSASNPDASILLSDGASVGNFVISEKCENKEVAIRLANWFYTTEGNTLATNGPAAALNLPDYGCLTETNGSGWTLKLNDAGYAVNDINVAQKDLMSAYQAMGFTDPYAINPDTGKSNWEYRAEIAGFAGKYTPNGTYDLTTGIGRHNDMIEKTLKDFGEPGAPSILYMDAETSADAADLMAVVKNYIVAETAKFITGSRPIDQVDDYLREVNAAGGDELNEIYNELYEAYKAGK